MAQHISSSDADIHLMEDNYSKRLSLITLEQCRICLNSGDIPMYGEENISEYAIQFGGINMTEDDDFPKYICLECYILLEGAIIFKKTALKSERVLWSDIKVKSEGSACSINSDEDSNDSTPTIQQEYLLYDESKSDCASDLDSKVNEIEMSLNIETNYGNSRNDNESTIFMPENSTESNIDNELCSFDESNLRNQSSLNVSYETKSCNPKLLMECKICGQTISKQSYKTHLSEHRQMFQKKKIKLLKKYKKEECKICGKSFNKTYIKFHMKIHGTDIDKLDRVKECIFCNKSFSYNYYSDHMKRVHGEKNDITKKIKTNIKKICPVCDTEVKEDKYDTHIARHGRPPKVYICDQCGKKFNQLSSLKTHHLTHTQELKYKCQFCPYRGLHLGLLKIHERTHTKDYPYECNQCSARFITKSNMTLHIRRHGNPTAYKCPECDKGFHAKRNLDKHYNLKHLKIRNHVCKICEIRFGHRDSLLSHERKVHNRKVLTDRVGRTPSYLLYDQNMI